MKYACQMSNRSAPSSLDNSVSPLELWYGHRQSFDSILPFGTLVTRGKHSLSIKSFHAGLNASCSNWP